MSEADSVEDEPSEPLLSDIDLAKAGMKVTVGGPWWWNGSKALLVAALIERCVNAWASVSDRMES